MKYNINLTSFYTWTNLKASKNFACYFYKEHFLYYEKTLLNTTKNFYEL